MIPGLIYIDDAIDEEFEETIINLIDFGDHINLSRWNESLKRRTQHYGYMYDYTSPNVTPTVPVPELFVKLYEQISETNKSVSGCPLDKLQVIVNEYLPGQGISPHIDHPRLFTEWVITVSLSSDICMRFEDGTTSSDIILKRRSIAILTGEARYRYKHSIPMRKSDVVNGVKQLRSRRVSITFRRIV
jgi:alkylated DNA repair dioxygenase AlkB